MTHFLIPFHSKFSSSTMNLILLTQEYLGRNHLEATHRSRNSSSCRHAGPAKLQHFFDYLDDRFIPLLTFITDRNSSTTHYLLSTTIETQYPAIFSALNFSAKLTPRQLFSLPTVTKVSHQTIALRPIKFLVLFLQPPTAADKVLSSTFPTAPPLQSSRPVTKRTSIPPALLFNGRVDD